MKLALSLGVFQALAFSAAVAQTTPVYNEQTQTLTIPAVNGNERAGEYQDVKLRNLGDNRWQLIEVGERPLITKVWEPEGRLVQVGSSPVQVYAEFSGQFSSGCEELGQVHQRRNGNGIELVAYYKPGLWLGPEPVTCTTALSPFSATVPLNLSGFQAGTYEVTVNGFSLGSFSIPDGSYDCSSGCEQAPPRLPAVYTEGLFVPVVDSVDRIGVYQNLIFKPTGDSDILQMTDADIGVELPVTTASVSLLESFPVQAVLRVTGQFGCYPSWHALIRSSGKVIEVAMYEYLPGYNWVPIDAPCDPQTPVVERTVLLDIYGDEAGEYQVRVNDTLTTSFVLSQDNRLP